MRGGGPVATGPRSPLRQGIPHARLGHRSWVSMTNDPFPRGTRRLILRHLVPNDADALRDLYGDWQIARWLSLLPWPFTSEAAEELIADAATQPVRGSGFVAIETHASCIFVGTISLRLPAYEPNPWTTDTRLGILGYAIAGERQGNGFAGEAASSVVRLAFDEMELDRLRATVLRDNVASRRVPWMRAPWIHDPVCGCAGDTALRWACATWTYVHARPL
jgi:RimJ/RimL family protein N-acetyltransferase